MDEGDGILKVRDDGREALHRHLPPVDERMTRMDAKTTLRDYHENGGTSLGHRLWGVSERTFREWLSPANKRQPPARVMEFIEGEAAHDRGFLASPGSMSLDYIAGRE